MYVIDGRPLPIDQLLERAVQIADALQAAHAKGLKESPPAEIRAHRFS